MTTIIRNMYAAKQRHLSSETFESREKMVAICILAMFTCDVTVCRVYHWQKCIDKVICINWLNRFAMSYAP